MTPKSLRQLIGQRLATVLVRRGMVQLTFEDYYGITSLSNSGVLTTPAGDIDCSHHRFGDYLHELINCLVSDVIYQPRKRIVFVFAEGVVSVGLEESSRSGPGMLLIGSGIPGSSNDMIVFRKGNPRLGPYPFDC